MKKFAFIINVFREDGFHSGGERLFYELVSRTVAEGHSVDLLCSTYLSDKEVLKSKLNSIKYVGKPKDYKDPEKIQSNFDEMKLLIDEENYDYVIAENITPPVGIVVLQGHSQLHYANMAGGFIARLIHCVKKRKHLEWQQKWIRKGYDKIYVPSKTLMNEIVRNFGLDEASFCVLYPGVDSPLGVTKPFNHGTCVTFGLSAPSFAKKGGYVFLKALRILKKQGHDFKANVICPKYSKNLFLKILLKTWGLDKEVLFWPYQKDMKDFYNSCDVVVMPSLLETFGLLALEGMSFGRVPVVSSYCGASEIISDGHNGFVFDMKKKPAENLAEKLRYTIENRCNMLSIANNSKTTSERFSWEAVYNNFKSDLNF